MYDSYPKFRGWNPQVYHERMETREVRELEAGKKGIKTPQDKGYPVLRQRQCIQSAGDSVMQSDDDKAHHGPSPHS